MVDIPVLIGPPDPASLSIWQKFAHAKPDERRALLADPAIRRKVLNTSGNLLIFDGVPPAEGSAYQRLAAVRTLVFHAYKAGVRKHISVPGGKTERAVPMDETFMTMFGGPGNYGSGKMPGGIAEQRGTLAAMFDDVKIAVIGGLRHLVSVGDDVAVTRATALREAEEELKDGGVDPGAAFFAYLGRRTRHCLRMPGMRADNALIHWSGKGNEKRAVDPHYHAAIIDRPRMDVLAELAARDTTKAGREVDGITVIPVTEALEKFRWPDKTKNMRAHTWVAFWTAAAEMLGDRGSAHRAAALVALASDVQEAMFKKGAGHRLNFAAALDPLGLNSLEQLDGFFGVAAGTVARMQTAIDMQRGPASRPAAGGGRGMAAYASGSHAICPL